MKATGLSDLAQKAFKANNNKVVGVDGRANRIVVNLSKNEKIKNSTYMPNIGVTRKPNFLTSNTKKTFNYLQLAFIKAPIFRHFDLENYIQIKTDASIYAIGGILSQFNLDSDKPLNDLNKSDFG